MIIPFHKMHGIGNDFILINETDLKTTIDNSMLASTICHRHFGVGADGLMIRRKSMVADARMEYYNSDGSVGEMCGNGIRCFARYVDKKHSGDLTKITIETMAGIKELTIKNTDDNQSTVSVNMGVPVIHEINSSIMIQGAELTYSYLTIGVPHVVIFIEKPDNTLIDIIGPLLEKHERFKNGTNVNFCWIENNDSMSVFTWERGAGHTLACGTGVTSAFSIAVRLEKVEKRVVVQAEGGKLDMYASENGSIIMTGPTKDICEGNYFYDQKFQL